MKKFLLIVSLFPLLSFAAADAEKINFILGIKLLDSSPSWKIADLHRRTGLPLRGTPGRYSVKMKQPVAGVPAEELIAYTAKNSRMVNRITIVFANKGDTSGKYKSKIKDAGSLLSTRISSAAGNKKRSQFVSGNYRNKADMWQFNGGKIYLEVNKKEFVMLHIVPDKAAADKKSSVNTDYRKNIVKNSFGDVYIKNIPMVDQGAKGYCVPATMERIFLYYGIQLDMHHIAEIGDTERGGGTYLNKMLRDINTLRKKSGLRTTRFSALSVKTVATHIDKGNPVMWAMFSTRELQSLYLFSKQKRPQAASPQEWQKKIRKADIPKKEAGPHVCLIIGYNAITDEIAVSNSWGQMHIAPTWIPVKAARKISQKHLQAFYP